MDNAEIMQSLKGGLIVSVQAEANEPLGKPDILAAIAQACVAGGAVGIRACQPQNIAAIRRAVTVPVTGLIKKQYPDSPVYITPTLSDCLKVIESGGQIIALDATMRPRPNGEQLSEIVRLLRRNAKVLLMADIATLEEGIQAAKMGMDIISTTLAGYTENTQARFKKYTPDFDLVEKLVKELDDKVPVIAEGRIWRPDDMQRMFDLGAWAVVIGSAITRPTAIVRWFRQALE